jgi:hypothetical protein
MTTVSGFEVAIKCISFQDMMCCFHLQVPRMLSKQGTSHVYALCCSSPSVDIILLGYIIYCRISQYSPVRVRLHHYPYTYRAGWAKVEQVSALSSHVIHVPYIMGKCAWVPRTSVRDLIIYNYTGHSLCRAAWPGHALHPSYIFPPESL